MFRYMMIIGIALTVVGQARADDQWYGCAQDAQCMIVHGNCGLEWAVNKDFADASRQALNPKGVCNMMPVFHPPGTTAQCVQGKCVLVSPAK